MNKLTQRQSEVLAFVKSHIEETGYPPTRADIAKELGFKSANAAEEHLKALARKGAIEMIPGTSRGIKLPESLGLPIIGRVAAGHPILAEAHIEDHCEIPPAFFNPAADYMLIVRGDSMIECGILDGDLLAVHSTPTAREGDIVVAENTSTVRSAQRHHPQQVKVIERVGSPEAPDAFSLTRDCEYHIRIEISVYKKNIHNYACN